MYEEFTKKKLIIRSTLVYIAGDFQEPKKIATVYCTKHFSQNIFAFTKHRKALQSKSTSSTRKITVPNVFCETASQNIANRTQKAQKRHNHNHKTKRSQHTAAIYTARIQ